MIYRESGQFKTTYKADQAILPIFQDKVAMSLLMLFAFGVGKAALFPFHSWLPSAMVAPTPVSALLHALCGLGISLQLRCFQEYLVFYKNPQQFLKV